jgi:hypothetical protein
MSSGSLNAPHTVCGPWRRRPLTLSRPTGSAPAAGCEKVPGMSECDYLACDGGPHLVLPGELSRQWKGAGSVSAVLNPESDYGPACPG